MYEHQLHRSLDSSAAIGPRDPIWPLPAINGRAPSALRQPSECRPGLDLAYPRRSAGELVTAFPPDGPNGSASHFMPNLVPALAVRDGVIAYAGKIGDSYSIILHHGDGWATFYRNLEHMFATPTRRHASRTARVRCGDVLGYVGAPQTGSKKRLGFELWQRDDHQLFNAVDPSEHMRGWLVTPWTDERFRVIEAPTAAA